MSDEWDLSNNFQLFQGYWHLFVLHNLLLGADAVLMLLCMGFFLLLQINFPLWDN